MNYFNMACPQCELDNCFECESSNYCHRCGHVVEDEEIIRFALQNYSHDELIEWIIDILPFNAQSEFITNLRAECEVK